MCDSNIGLNFFQILYYTFKDSKIIFKYESVSWSTAGDNNNKNNMWMGSTVCNQVV